MEFNSLVTNVTANNEDPRCPAINLIDNNTNTEYTSTYIEPPYTFVFTLSKNFRAVSFQYCTRCNANIHGIKNFTIYGSMNGSSYTQIYTGNLPDITTQKTWSQLCYITSPGNYLYYKVIVNTNWKTYTKNFFAASEMKFFSEDQKYFIENESLIKYWNGTNFESLGTVFTNDIITNYGNDDPNDIINNLNQLHNSRKLIVYDGSNPINMNGVITSKPRNNLIISDFISLSDTLNIDSLTLTSTVSTNSSLKIILSPNGEEWFTYKNSIWMSTSKTINDCIINGMTPAEFNALGANINSIINNDNKRLKFAFYLDLGLATDTLSINTLSYQVDLKGIWKSGKEIITKYDISFTTNNSCQISIIEPGTFKINY